ncbi:Chordin-like protein 2 [Varanus komodoensis]|nr:Chordin-like protein 2 [Varanus komodoensis]
MPSKSPSPNCDAVLCDWEKAEHTFLFHGSDAFCTFDGKKYSAGESWHPYLEPVGVMYCLRCTCAQDASVSCYQIQCPVLQCPDPISDRQQCCPRCPELQASPRLQAPVNSSCQHNGTTYQHGDMFTHSDLFPSRQSNQCAQCSCSEGQIYCGLVSCLDLLCPSPQSVPGTCCPVCRDGSNERLIEEPQLTGGVKHPQHQCLGDSRARGALGLTDPRTSASLELISRNVRSKGRIGTTVKIILKEDHKKACVYNGETYSHGEVWHPTVRYITHLPCILCTCRDGTQDCQKVTCPKVYPCEEPEAVEGKCCKACPEDKVAPAGGIGPTKCRVSVYMFVPPASGTEHPGENLRKVAIERESSEEVEIYIWKLVRGIFHLIQIKKVKKLEFRQEVQDFRLVSRTSGGTRDPTQHLGRARLGWARRALWGEGQRLAENAVPRGRGRDASTYQSGIVSSSCSRGGEWALGGQCEQAVLSQHKKLHGAAAGTARLSQLCVGGAAHPLPPHAPPPVLIHSWHVGN